MSKLEVQITTLLEVSDRQDVRSALRDAWKALRAGREQVAQAKFDSALTLHLGWR